MKVTPQRLAQVQAVVFEIFKTATGARPSSKFDLGELEHGWEALIAATQEAFELDDDWPTNGARVNGTLGEYAAYVAECAKSGTPRKSRGVSPALFEAASTGDAARVAELIAKGADVNAIDDAQGWTALHYAVAADRVEVVRTLLAAGADRSIGTTRAWSERGDGRIDKGTPAWAINHTAAQKLLLPKGGMVRDRDGNTLLHRAAAETSVSRASEIAYLVDELGIDVNAVNAFGWTALHYSSWRIVHGEFVAKLVARGADASIRSTKLHKKTKAGTSAADLIAAGGYQYSDGTRAIRWIEYPPYRCYEASAAELIDPPKTGHEAFATDELASKAARARRKKRR